MYGIGGGVCPNTGECRESLPASQTQPTHDIYCSASVYTWNRLARRKSTLNQHKKNYFSRSECYTPGPDSPASNRIINYFLTEPQYIEYLSQPFILNIDIQVKNIDPSFVLK